MGLGGLGVGGYIKVGSMVLDRDPEVMGWGLGVVRV